MSDRYDVDSCLSRVLKRKQVKNMTIYLLYPGADRQATFNRNIVKGDGNVLPAGTTERWLDFPSAQAACPLTNGQTARGSWVDYDWPNRETSALQAALKRLDCIADSEEELENT
jgi:hypothetical protein